MPGPAPGKTLSASEHHQDGVHAVPVPHPTPPRKPVGRRATDVSTPTVGVSSAGDATTPAHRPHRRRQQHRPRTSLPRHLTPGHQQPPEGAISRNHAPAPPTARAHVSGATGGGSTRACDSRVHPCCVDTPRPQRHAQPAARHGPRRALNRRSVHVSVPSSPVTLLASAYVPVAGRAYVRPGRRHLLRTPTDTRHRQTTVIPSFLLTANRCPSSAVYAVVVGYPVQYVAGLTTRRAADRVERREPHRLRAAVPQYGDVGGRDADSSGELADGQTASGELGIYRLPRSDNQGLTGRSWREVWQSTPSSGRRTAVTG